MLTYILGILSGILTVLVGSYIDKRKQDTLFRENAKNENFNLYSNYLVEIMAQIVVEYNPDPNKEEKFDPSNKVILLPLLKLFGYFDVIYSRSKMNNQYQKGQISDELFKYWDESINLMMKESFYQTAWKYIKKMDYYSEDFVQLMDKKTSSLDKEMISVESFYNLSPKVFQEKIMFPKQKYQYTTKCK